MRCIAIGEDRPKTYQGCNDCSKECRGGFGEKCGSTSTASTPLLVGVGGWRVDFDLTRIDHRRGSIPYGERCYDRARYRKGSTRRERRGASKRRSPRKFGPQAPYAK